MCEYIYISRGTDTYNYVLMFHTRRPSSYSAREETRMRPLVPCVYLPVLICVVSQACVWCTYSGFCVQGVRVHAHVPTRNTPLAPPLVGIRVMELQQPPFCWATGPSPPPE